MTPLTIFEKLHYLDQDITLWLNMHQPSGAIDSIMIFFSKIPVWFPLYAITIFFVFWKNGVVTGMEKKKHFTNAWASLIYVLLGMGLTLLLCDQTANLFKNGIERLRPCHDSYMLSNGLRILEGTGGYYGFFSGHASNAFGWAMVTSLIFRKKWYTIAIYVWAALLAISRIYVGKHYLGDILVGTVFGLFFGWLSYKICTLAIDFIKKKMSQKIQHANG